MQDKNVRFIRVGGRVIPIHSEKELKKQRAQGAAAAAGGAYAVKHSVPRVTGRTTYYHGTTKDYASRIRSVGIRPGESFGISDMFDKKSAGFDAKKYTYMTGSRKQARMYANQAAALDALKGRTRAKDMAGALDEFTTGIDRKIENMRPFLRKDADIVKLSIPFGDKRVKFVKNPEMRGARNWQELLTKLSKDKQATERMARGGYVIGQNPFIDKRVGKMMMKGLDTPTVEGAIGAEFIKGSANYQRLGFREVARYAKANKGRFAAGLALGAAGLAAVGWGTNRFLKSFQKEKK
jgi:hypothetical protein